VNCGLLHRLNPRDIEIPIQVAINASLADSIPDIDQRDAVIKSIREPLEKLRAYAKVMVGHDASANVMRLYGQKWWEKIELAIKEADKALEE
jgi:hypothetical protein